MLGKKKRNIVYNKADIVKLDSSRPTTDSIQSVTPSSQPKSQPLPTASSTFQSPFKSSGGLVIKPTIKSSPVVKPTSLKPSVTVTELPATQGDVKYFMAMWAKHKPKKHKIWEDEGVLVVKGKDLTLLDMKGTSIGKSNSYSIKDLPQLLFDGSELLISGKDVQVGSPLGASEVTSGRIFAASAEPVPITAPPPTSFGPVKMATGRITHVPNASAPVRQTTQKSLRPLISPETPGAFVLYNPDSMVGKEVAVVLEPLLARNMRPHQLDGVKFMFECVMGLRGIPNGGTGCILADEMGLGKTLQSIALIRVLLTQSPLRQPAANKAIIVTPSSLVQNWAVEIKKWLGKTRLDPVVVGDQSAKATKDAIRMFSTSPISPLLIISYESLRSHAELLANVEFGLMICDEGHRLKNADSKTNISLMELNCSRRVVLSGTPFQNNIGEFFTLAEFVNPGVFGPPDQFRATYERPINTSRDPKCSPVEKKLGEERAAELTRITSTFIMRRTSRVLEQFLPPKIEHVVFLKPTDLQLELYRSFLGSSTVRSLLSGIGTALESIMHLKKLCNHPELLLSVEETEEGDHMDSQAFDFFPSGYLRGSFDVNISSKVAFLSSLLSKVKTTTSDKAVVISNYTKTLDMLQLMCERNAWKFVRLDGSTENKERQRRVQDFQTDPSIFVFLLSTKAGGVGFNLPAANRLVLFDSDWNPALDQQAQARVWRDGQTKTTYIYRLLTTGSIEEKIFQRQLVKIQMSKTLVDSVDLNGGAGFSPDDLKDIFQLNNETLCDTHELSGCTCLEVSSPTKKRKVGSKKSIGAEEIADWSHVRDAGSPAVQDMILKGLVHQLDAQVTFLFVRETHPDAIKRTFVEPDSVHDSFAVEDDSGPT